MIRTILVPLDGSPFAEHALPLALTIARRARAALQLVQVHVPLISLDGPLFLDNAPDARIHAEERAYLDGLVQRLASHADFLVQSALLNGAVGEQLLRHVQAAAVDLIVMTTHGRGGLSRLWLGSVADELVRNAPAPVLVLRPGEGAPALEAEYTLRHILIPLDSSPLAEDILEPALTLGELMGADYTLLEVVRPVAVSSYELSGGEGGRDLPPAEQPEKKAWCYLERLARGLWAEGRRVDVRVLTHKHPARAILGEASARGGADLIAVATHGRHGLKRLLLGSVADKLVRGSTAPVLVHRPRSLERKEDHRGAHVDDRTPPSPHPAG